MTHPGLSKRDRTSLYPVRDSKLYSKFDSRIRIESNLETNKNDK